MNHCGTFPKPCGAFVVQEGAEGGGPVGHQELGDRHVAGSGRRLQWGHSFQDFAVVSVDFGTEFQQEANNLLMT